MLFNENRYKITLDISCLRFSKPMPLDIVRHSIFNLTLYSPDGLTKPTILVHADRTTASAVFQKIVVYTFVTLVRRFSVVLAWRLVAALAMLPGSIHVNTLE